jgi:hypothetical protein
VINKDSIRGFAWGAFIGLIAIASYAAAEERHRDLTMDSKAMMGAMPLFRVGNCEVWGFNWRSTDRVVAVCPVPTTQPTCMGESLIPPLK